MQGKAAASALWPVKGAKHESVGSTLHCVNAYAYTYQRFVYSQDMRVLEPEVRCTARLIHRLFNHNQPRLSNKTKVAHG